MGKGFKTEQIKNEKPEGWETNIGKLAKTVGNQAMVQMMPGKRKRDDEGGGKHGKKRKKDEDGDFVPDPEEVKAEEELDDWEEAIMSEEIQYSPEDVPKKLCYTPADKDCFGGEFDFSCVHIEMTGKRSQDNEEADRKLKEKHKDYDGTHKGYTWHHMATDIKEECDMVLVKTDVHSNIVHIGAVRQYEYLKRGEEDEKFKYGP